MDFESKIELAVEMANFRIEAGMNNAGAYKDLVNEELPSRGKQTIDLYTECVRAMFDLITELEQKHNS